MLDPASWVRIRARSRIVIAVGGVALGSALPATVEAAPPGRSGRFADSTRTAAAATTPAPAERGTTASPDPIFGRSGKLRFLLVGPTTRFTMPVLERLFGTTAGKGPGVFPVQDSTIGRPFSLISLLPFSAKSSRGEVDGYRVGRWPAERRRARSEAYENPEGFIRVTAANQDTYVSEHFRLRDFLTKDQRDVWPKYLVLDPDLIDKLELVIDELNASGVKVSRMVVMSGFRTPQYNARGVGRGGRAKDSRHQFGDAADVFVDNDGDGRMDDLNRDGRVNTRDARVIERAVERVEARWPDLVGGVGLYRANRAHGPFAHVDVRGYRARWGNS